MQEKSVLLWTDKHQTQRSSLQQLGIPIPDFRGRDALAIVNGLSDVAATMAAASYHKFEMCWNFALESLAVSAASLGAFGQLIVLLSTGLLGVFGEQKKLLLF